MIELLKRELFHFGVRQIFHCIYINIKNNKLMTEQPIQEASTERDLVKIFTEFKLPASIEETYRQGNFVFGPRSHAKFVFFAANVGLQNEDYDDYMAIKPARHEMETYERYKQRQKFQKFLAKFKPYFYDYSVYDLDAKKRKIAARKLKKQQ